MKEYTKQEITVEEINFVSETAGPNKNAVLACVESLYEDNWYPQNITIKELNDGTFDIGGVVARQFTRQETDKEFDDRVAQELLKQYKNKNK